MLETDEGEGWVWQASTVLDLKGARWGSGQSGSVFLTPSLPSRQAGKRPCDKELYRGLCLAPVSLRCSVISV